jgi:hypothetical protein
MYEYTLKFLNEYVEIYTYLSQEKLYGEIVKITPLEMVLQRDKSSDKNSDLHIPLNAVISIKKL